MSKHARFFIQSLSKLLKIFLDLQLEFVIVGGFAGVLHGSSLVTQDLDLCFLLSEENITKLRVALKDYHPYLRITPQKLSFLQYPADISKIKNLYLATDIGVIDLLSHITGVGDYNRVTEQAVQISVFGQACKVMSLDDLILAKSAMNRPKDAAMLRELQIIKAKLNN